MSYKEKQTIVSILSGLLLLVIYSFYALSKVQSGVAAPDDLKFWATAILTFIVIGIVATIIIQIIFHILLSISIAVKGEVKKEIQKEITKRIQNETQNSSQNDSQNNSQNNRQVDPHYKDPCNEQDIERTIALEMVEDEMDKLIELKSMRVGFAIAGIGFVLSLISLVLDYAPAVMLNIAFFSFSIGSMIEGIVKLFYYKRGIQNG